MSTAPPSPATGPVTQDEKMIAMIAHLVTFLSSFIGPLVIWLMKKDDSPFVADHAREVLNFQITLLIYGAICAVLVFLFIGILLLPLLGLFAMIVTIIGAVKASSGEMYRYPLTLRLI